MRKKLHFPFGLKKSKSTESSSRKLFIALSVVLLLCGLTPAHSQRNPWFVGIHAHGGHVLTDFAAVAASSIANLAICDAFDNNEIVPFEVSAYRYHYFKMEDNGETVDFKRNNSYGHTAYDLFNDIEAGIKVGWQGAESPIGIYLYGAYGLNQYKLRFLGEQSYNRHQLQSLKAGVGIRISPLRFLLEEYNWCPIIEVGSIYINNFNYKGPYGNDKKQINNGMRTSYAIGAQFGDESRFAILLCMDMAHYDMFNREYTPDGGLWYPYANIKNKDMNFSLNIRINIID